jgi:hypothetical protein
MIRNVSKLWFLLFIHTSIMGQQSDAPAMEAGKILTSLKIDGALSEAAWIDAKDISNFWTNFPSDSTTAKAQTIVKVVYNDEFIYIGATMQTLIKGNKYIASSLRRDFPFIDNDAFGVILDTYRDQTNGYGFYVSAFGVQREEQIYSNTTTDGTWDTRWHSAVSYDTTSWTVEIAIPLKSVRFKDDLSSWNINFVRNDITTNERSSWVRVPRNFSLPNLAYHGQIIWTAGLNHIKKNFSLIPSTTFTASQKEQNDIDTHARLSLDAKVAVTSSLNLDITVNPDFSQAEVDQVQLNITRFELVFPEKRFFFIENSDLFSEFGITTVGTSPVRPFYSRRIGLQYNSSISQYEQTQLLGGLRLSGKLNKNLRIGAMSVQTAELDQAQEGAAASKAVFPSENYSVLALQQKVFSRSNIGLILENRQAMKADSLSDFGFNKNDYNRLAGLEFNLVSKDNTWTGKAYTHLSWENNTDDHPAYAYGLFITRNTLKLTPYGGFTKTSTTFTPDMGFVPRRDYVNAFGGVDRKFYTTKASSKLNFIAPLIHYDIYLDSSSRKMDHQWRYGFYITFKNTSYMYLLGWHEYTRLFSDFNPASNEGPVLHAGSVHRYSAGSIYYKTDSRKSVFGTLWLKTGQYFNGKFLQTTITMDKKLQPWGTVGLNYNLNVIELPEPYSSNTIFAVGPKAEISFTKSLFLNTILQYNSQSKNLGYYLRIQWRFRPLSDLYIIYTNNRNTEPWLQRNQALTVKLVYWM